MRFRRITGLVVVVALLGMVFPATSEAAFFGGGPAGDVGELEAGIFARVIDWVEGFLTQVLSFVTVEGAVPMGGG